MLNTVRKDLVYALRMIVKTPIVAGVAILSLAVGVSANTTVFAILHSWLLRPLPYADADRIDDVVTRILDFHRKKEGGRRGVRSVRYGSRRGGIVIQEPPSRPVESVDNLRISIIRK